MQQVKIKNPYRGLARLALYEDKLVKHESLKPYDILDDSGQAYVLTSSSNEIKIEPFQGKWVYPNLFRIAAFPVINKEDEYYIEGLKDKAIAEAKEAILKQEDCKLLVLLGAAIKDYNTNKDHIISPGHIIEVDGIFNQKDFNTLVGKIKLHRIDVKNILVNPMDSADLDSFTSMERYTIIESESVPEGNLYLLPDKSFVGPLTVMYDVDIEDNHILPKFQRGWVVDELIGMAILNPRGLGVLRKKSVTIDQTNANC